MYPLEEIIYQATNQLDKKRIIYSHINKKNYNFYIIFSSNWNSSKCWRKKNTIWTNVRTERTKNNTKNRKKNNMKNKGKQTTWKINKDWLVYDV